MGQRIGGFLVVLEEDISEERAERVMAALGMISGVVKVVKQPTDISTVIAETRVKHEVAGKLFDFASSFLKTP